MWLCLPPENIQDIHDAHSPHSLIHVGNGTESDVLENVTRRFRTSHSPPPLHDIERVNALTCIMPRGAAIYPYSYRTPSGPLRGRDGRHGTPSSRLSALSGADRRGKCRAAASVRPHSAAASRHASSNGVLGCRVRLWSLTGMTALTHIRGIGPKSGRVSRSPLKGPFISYDVIRTEQWLGTLQSIHQIGRRVHP